MRPNYERSEVKMRAFFDHFRVICDPYLSMRPDDERNVRENVFTYFLNHFRSVEASYGALASI